MLIHSEGREQTPVIGYFLFFCFKWILFQHVKVSSWQYFSLTGNQNIALLICEFCYFNPFHSFFLTFAVFRKEMLKEARPRSSTDPDRAFSLEAVFSSKTQSELAKLVSDPLPIVSLSFFLCHYFSSLLPFINCSSLQCVMGSECGKSCLVHFHISFFCSFFLFSTSFSLPSSLCVLVSLL